MGAKAPIMEPDYVFNKHPLPENWYDFELKTSIGEGDEVTFKTETTERKTPLEIIEYSQGAYILESVRGTKYILSVTTLHELEPYVLTVRTHDGYNSLGEVREIKVFKGD